MGLFTKRKKVIKPKIEDKLDELAKRGNQFEKEGRYKEAIQVWEEGLNLIPKPQNFYSETVWFLVSIGDIYFQKKSYQKAYEYFNEALGNLSGKGMVIHLSCFDWENAV